MSYRDDIMAATKLPLPWDNLSGRNILVTGATGLIGSTLVEVLLSRKGHDYNVYAAGRNVDRATKLFASYFEKPTFHFICHDVTRPLESHVNFHYIIHCASGAAPIDFAQYPVEVMKANILGVDNLLDYGRKHELKRMLYVSSGEVYGEGDGRVFTEDYSGYVNPIMPRSCYPSSKRAAETLGASYSAEYGMDVVFARPCHTYGPHFTENDNRVYAQFIRNILHNENIVLKSKGEQIRSWCYVVDCVSALLYILMKGVNCQAYNIADERSCISIRVLADIIAEIGDKRVETITPDLEEKTGYNVVTKSVFSTENIRKLGWTPTCPIIEGFRKSIEEQRKYEGNRN